jgi:hypothetical protein
MQLSPFINFPKVKSLQGGKKGLVRRFSDGDLVGYTFSRVRP